MKFSSLGKLLLFVCFTAAFCNGCWDRKEFNQLAIAQTIAVDYEDGEYQLTVQLLMPNTAEETISSKNIWIIDGKGKSVGDAMENLALRAPRELYLNHLDIVLLGEGLMKQDVGQGIEYLMKQHVLRRRTSLLATEGRAGDIVQAQSDLAEVDIYYLANLTRDQRRHVKESETIINDYYIAMDNHVQETLVIPKVALAGEKEIKMAGAALIRDRKLLSWVDQEWLSTYFWITGGKEIVTLQNVGAQHYDVTLEVRKEKYKWELLSKEPLQVEVTFRGTLYMTENDKAAEGLSLDELEAFNESMKKVVEAELTSRIEQDIAQMQEQGADILHLGRWLYAWHPDLMPEETWAEAFSKIKIAVKMETNLELYELK